MQGLYNIFGIAIFANLEDSSFKINEGERVCCSSDVTHSPCVYINVSLHTHLCCALLHRCITTHSSLLCTITSMHHYTLISVVHYYIDASLHTHLCCALLHRCITTHSSLLCTITSMHHYTLISVNEAELDRSVNVSLASAWCDAPHVEDESTYGTNFVSLFSEPILGLWESSLILKKSSCSFFFRFSSSSRTCEETTTRQM